MTEISAPPSTDRDLSAERHVATIAALNLASAIAMAVLAGLTLFGTIGSESRSEQSFYALAAGFFFLLGAANLVVWHGLPRFSLSAWFIQLAIGFVALPGFPLGTLWGAYVLWALLRSRGRRLFSAPYRRARLEHATEPKARPFVPIVVGTVILGTSVVALGFFTVRQELQMLLEQEEAARRDRDSQIDDALEEMREDGEEN